jgi:hypothetical protein
MKPEAEREVMREEKRHTDEVVRICGRWPEYRLHMAHALLGGAVAVCDSFGVDVERFIAELRRREPMPPVLVPPASGRS